MPFAAPVTTAVLPEKSYWTVMTASLQGCGPRAIVQPHPKGGEDHERGIACGCLVVARCNAPVLLETVHQALNAVALAIAAPVHEVGWAFIPSLENDGPDATATQISARCMAGVAPVSYHRV